MNVCPLTEYRVLLYETLHNNSTKFQTAAFGLILLGVRCCGYKNKKDNGDWESFKILGFMKYAEF